MPVTGYQMATDPTDVMGKRVAEYLIDIGIGLALSFGLFFAFVTRVPTSCDLLGTTVYVELNDTCYTLVGNDYWLFQGVLVGYWLLNWVVLQGLLGASIGKFVVGVRVVRPDGRPMGILRAIGRWIVTIVDAFPWCIPMLTGFLVANSSWGHQRIADKAVGTFVVGRDFAGSPINLAPRTVPVAVPYGSPVQPPQGAPGQPPGYGGPPAAGTSPGFGAGPPQAPGGAGDPEWDAARQAYIQYDHTAGEWRQWNEALRQWGPIETG
ncbi:MAG: hypothetical protein JJLCMIEE_00585 [Acidimicrobiales bacterium]|nr:MAG: RDD family protein [Actinomycetota bacterium]MBV6507536.1 hypothetical protein [Acidimicrobiales bacterium]RIK07478.1 MAG: hypothetical protein DCC48_02950 [Acidobacteriota bacterium]